MASVYLAVQESLDREVALKIMAPALTVDPQFATRFFKEGRITARLSHPHLLTVFDIGRHGSTCYLATEYLPGGTLSDRLEQGIGVAESLDVACGVAKGLNFAHDAGFVHRDVKPSNVMFRASGAAVLADFGIAKSMGGETSVTKAGSAIGTPRYMSPEQISGAEVVDGRSDLYSLGVMLFELLTGKPPYDADELVTLALMHLTHPTPQLPPASAWLQPLIDRLMAKDPEARFASGAEFVASVEHLTTRTPDGTALRNAPGSHRQAAYGSSADGEPAVQPQASRGPKALPRRLVVVAIVATLAILGGAAWKIFLAPSSARTNARTALDTPERIDRRAGDLPALRERLEQAENKSADSPNPIVDRVPEVMPQAPSRKDTAPDAVEQGHPGSSRLQRPHSHVPPAVRRPGATPGSPTSQRCTDIALLAGLGQETAEERRYLLENCR